MKIGVCSANSGPYTTRDMLVLLSEAAEKVGLESIWVSEHLVVPDPRTPPSQMDPDDPILDPVTALAFMAGRTRSVRLGTGIIVLPIRNPLILAKELATVDVLSGGRLMFGIGVGYVQREFEALDASFGDRGTRTEEYLAAIRSIWTERHPVFAGRMVSFAGVQAFPHPVQQPHPPIVMGGYAPAVMRRTIREADGWYGWGLDLEATARRVDILRETASRVPRGEGLGSLEITITPPGDVDVETAARYAALGVHRLNLMLRWGAGRDDVDGFFERVMQPLVEADLE
ncbi:MAG TPA: TIGR03619 family F420-dependent LLM class oxidoreductase [Actinomycetota bacterium]|jgi:probable F420-dependent oxidoreductase